MLQEGKREESSKEKTLICPLLATRRVTFDDSVKRMVGAGVPNACMREDCAWWNAERTECALLSLARISASE